MQKGINMKTMSQYISVDDLADVESEIFEECENGCVNRRGEPVTVFEPRAGYFKKDVDNLPKKNIIHCIECIHWQKMGGCTDDKMACNIAYWFCEATDYCFRGEHA